MLADGFVHHSDVLLEALLAGRLVLARLELALQHHLAVDHLMLVEAVGGRAGVVALVALVRLLARVRPLVYRHLVRRLHLQSAAGVGANRTF